MSSPSVTMTAPPPLAGTRPQVQKLARLSDAPTRADIARAALFVLAHVVLGLAMHAVHVIATVHALAVVTAGMIFAATTKQIRQVAIVIAYIAGCEVLWRMNKAGVFWEFSKYSIAAIAVIALARFQWRRNRVVAIAYFLLLVPSAALTFAALDLDGARQEVSYYLSGPLAIALAVLFFSNIRLDLKQRRITYLAVLAPATGIAAVAFRSMISRIGLEFANASSMVASGGFGPNQVSAMLGLGAMVSVLMAFDRRLAWSVRAPLVALAFALSAQATLTFSRGGLMLAVAGACGAAFVQLGSNRRGRVTVILVGLLLVAVGKFVIEPRLDAFTGGKLTQRYSSTKSSGRDLFIDSELEMFSDSPVLGVGPGIGVYFRKAHGEFFGASHTEYSRMLGEHGILGVLALGCLIVLWIRAVKGTKDPTSRAASVAFVIWFALFLAVYDTRIAAPAFALGMACVLPPAVMKPKLRRAA